MDWYLKEIREQANFIPKEYRRLKFSLPEYSRAERIVHVILAHENKGELSEGFNYSVLENFILKGTFRIEDSVSNHASFRRALNYLIDDKKFIERVTKVTDKRVKLFRLKWDKISSRMVDDNSWFFWEFFESVSKPDVMFNRKYNDKSKSFESRQLRWKSALRELLLDIREEEIVCRICFSKSKFIFESVKLDDHEKFVANYHCNNCGFSSFVFFPFRI